MVEINNDILLRPFRAYLKEDSKHRALPYAKVFCPFRVRTLPGLFYDYEAGFRNGVIFFDYYFFFKLRKKKLKQTTHYYLFGLPITNMEEYQSIANGQKCQGNEWLTEVGLNGSSFGVRQYHRNVHHPQIGRFRV